MKAFRLKLAILAFWPALAIFAGCSQKKPVLVKPPAAPAPTAAAEPSPTPTPEGTQPAEKEQSQSQQEQPTQATTPDQTKPETAQKDKPAHPKKPSPRKVAPAGSDKTTTEARNNPPKKIIPAEKAQPTPAPGQISPGLTPADGASNQASTEQLLQSAESNLSAIKRQLSKEEESMRTQVKEFIAQSRRATTENDPARAHNLAVKARLLSDELVRQR